MNRRFRTVRAIGQDIDWGDFFSGDVPGVDSALPDLSVDTGGITGPGGLDTGGFDIPDTGAWNAPLDSNNPLGGVGPSPVDTSAASGGFDWSGLEHAGGQLLLGAGQTLLKNLLGGPGTSATPGVGVPTPGRPGYTTTPDGRIIPTPSAAAAGGMPSWVLPAVIIGGIFLLLKRK